MARPSWSARRHSGQPHRGRPRPGQEHGAGRWLPRHPGRLSSSGRRRAGDERRPVAHRRRPVGGGHPGPRATSATAITTPAVLRHVSVAMDLAEVIEGGGPGARQATAQGPPAAVDPGRVGRPRQRGTWRSQLAPRADAPAPAADAHADAHADASAGSGSDAAADAARLLPLRTGQRAQTSVTTAADGIGSLRELDAGERCPREGIEPPADEAGADGLPTRNGRCRRGRGGRGRSGGARVGLLPGDSGSGLSGRLAGDSGTAATARAARSPTPAAEPASGRAGGPEVAALSAWCAAVSSGSTPGFAPVAPELLRPPPARPPIFASWGEASDDDAASRRRAMEPAAGGGGRASGQGRSTDCGTAATSGSPDGGNPGAPELYRPPTEPSGSGHQAEGACGDDAEEHPGGGRPDAGCTAVREDQHDSPREGEPRRPPGRLPSGADQDDTTGAAHHADSGRSPTSAPLPPIRGAEGRDPAAAEPAPAHHPSSGPSPVPDVGRGNTGTRDDGDPLGEGRCDGSSGVEVHSSSAEDSVDESSTVMRDIRAIGHNFLRRASEIRDRHADGNEEAAPGPPSHGSAGRTPAGILAAARGMRGATAPGPDGWHHCAGTLCAGSAARRDPGGRAESDVRAYGSVGSTGGPGGRIGPSNEETAPGPVPGHDGPSTTVRPETADVPATARGTRSAAAPGPGGWHPCAGTLAAGGTVLVNSGSTALRYQLFPASCLDGRIAGQRRGPPPQPQAGAAHPRAPPSERDSRQNRYTAPHGPARHAHSSNNGADRRIQARAGRILPAARRRSTGFQGSGG